MRRPLAALLLGAAMATTVTAKIVEDASGDLALAFGCEVDRRLEVPAGEREAYAARLRDALEAAGLRDLAPQQLVMVDRSPAVQAGFLYRLAPDATLVFEGAFPVATGLPGEFEHFATPLGVFEHTLANPDFRAEGTRNDNGILGYGERGRRVFDFGWVDTPRGWGDQHESEMRLQMHATDPDLLEPLLGRARSKGCIRIPASVDEFLDRRGVLDHDYEAAALDGHPHWVLRDDRQATRWPGRYLVVVDSGRDSRPGWSPVTPRAMPRPKGCA